MDDITSLDFGNLEVISNVENLINTAYEGCNIIDAKRSTFNFLKNLGVFGTATISKIKQIIEFNNEYHSIYGEIDFKIYVSGRSSGFSRNGNEWTIPLSSFNYGNLSGLELLAEDESDAKLLIYSIKHHQSLNSDLRNFNISVTPSNGGGANIKKIIVSKIEAQEKILVCFCDSDKLSQFSELGDVTKECREKSNTADFPCFFFHTDGREIENDLPFYFIDEVINFQNNSDVKSSFLNIKSIYQIDANIIRFSDYKEGISYNDIQNITCSDSKRFWEDTIERLYDNELLVKPLKEGDVIIHHLSKSIASNVLDWLDYKIDLKPKRVHEIIKSDVDAQAWLKHGENLFWLATGMKKGRI